MRSSQLVELCEKTGSMELPPFFILFIVADVTSVSNLRKFAMSLVRGSLAGECVESTALDGFCRFCISG